MNKFFTSLLVLLIMAGLCSCTIQRKPESPDNTIIVPEVSRVGFDTIDLKDAPKAVRDMAKAVEKQDAAAWGLSGGKAYILISRGERTDGFNVKVDDVLQRLPEEGFTWIEVKLAYEKKKEQAGNDREGVAGEAPVTVVRADIKETPRGVGFTMTGLDSDSQDTDDAAPPNRPLPGPKPGTGQPAPNIQAGAVIEQPAANQEISSPVKVQGNVRAAGQKRVRIVTRGGQIIKEEVVNPSPETGDFNVDITYSPPEMATPGEISLISVGGDEKVLTRVPVIIK